MYETGNQKDRDKKRIVLRHPRRQHSRDSAGSMAQCAECTGCCYRIRSTVPCHRTRCRTWHQLKQSRKSKQRPAGRCCFYRRFVHFNMMLLRSANDSLIYQSTKEPDTYSVTVNYSASKKYYEILLVRFIWFLCVLLLLQCIKNIIFSQHSVQRNCNNCESKSDHKTYQQNLRPLH